MKEPLKNMLSFKEILVEIFFLRKKSNQPHGEICRDNFEELSGENLREFIGKFLKKFLQEL